MEIVSVIAIIGILLTVIVPRAQRAKTEAKYQILRQNCSELASLANEWAIRELESQDIDDTSNLNDYMETLGGAGDTPGTLGWIGEKDASNWNDNAGFTNVVNRAADPSAAVSNLIPPENSIRNPFNGTSLFKEVNDPSIGGDPIPGAVACAWRIDGSIEINGETNHRYYALIFMGVDSTENINDFHGGQTAATVAGLRNGVLVATLDPR